LYFLLGIIQKKFHTCSNADEGQSRACSWFANFIQQKNRIRSNRKNGFDRIESNRTAQQAERTKCNVMCKVCVGCCEKLQNFVCYNTYRPAIDKILKRRAFRVAICSNFGSCQNVDNDTELSVHGLAVAVARSGVETRSLPVTSGALPSRKVIPLRSRFRSFIAVLLIGSFSLRVSLRWNISFCFLFQTKFFVPGAPVLRLVLHSTNTAVM